MRDKISRLSRGMIDIETPSIRILPESVSDRMIAGSRDSFELEVVSTNGFSVRGAVFSDSPRISSETRTFMGRRVHIRILLNAAGLAAGERLKGDICLVTNAGEFRVPCDILCVNEKEAGGSTAAETAEGPEQSGTLLKDNLVPNPLVYDRSAFTALPKPASLDEEEASGEDAETEEPRARFIWRSGDGMTGTGADGLQLSEQRKLLTTAFPEDEPLFEGVLSALIRAKDDSPEAFAFYREAIRRNISVTRLYESYIHAFPAESDEMMPREVLLYFSYERDPEAAIREKLYKNVLLYVDRDSELYAIYEPRISHFAMNSVLEHRISEDLCVIYDKMIYPGMIDRRAAECLPDILKAHRIRVNTPDVKYITLSYPELGTKMQAQVSGGVAYVPKYFPDAVITLDPANAEFTDEAMFQRPDLLRRCFDMFSEHRMLLLSAVREIADRGIRGEDEIAVCTKALSTLKLQPDFRSRLIGVLCATEAEPRWISSLKPEDYTPELASGICRVLMKHGHCEEAWKIMKSCGSWEKDPALTADLTDALIRADQIPSADGQPEKSFVSICKYVFDRDPQASPDSVLELLGYAYEGPAGEMYRILSELQNRKRKLYDLPENILAYLLFTNCTEHIDEAFLAYVDNCNYTDMMVRAYLIRRSADYFLDEQEVIGSILFEALFSYLKAVDDPQKQPEIMLLALTKYWSEKEQLTGEEVDFCQRITDKLIDEGLIFHYTKKLRKKIRIPREICDRFYVEYHGDPQTAPRLMVRIRPDEKEFHPEEMKRVYRNIYIFSTLLFMGDEMHYLIYHVPLAAEPSEEGVIKVTKFHRQKDDRFECLNYMLKAISDKDQELLRENMLKYVETREVMKELYKL